MKVILLSIHAMEDDRIRRHIQYLFDVGIDVYYLHYNVTQPELKAGEFNYAGAKGFRINPISFNKIIKKTYLLSPQVYKDSLNALRHLKISRSDKVILHVHNPENLKIASKLKKSFFISASTVYDRHEYYEKYKGFLGIKTLFLMEARHRHYIDHVILVSDEQKIIAAKLFNHAGFSTVPNYPNGSVYDLDMIDEKITKIKNNGEIVLSYVGSLYSSFNRDIELLLKIANGTLRHYSSVKIILAGDVKDAETERRLSELAQLFPDRFLFKGYVSRQEAIEITSRSHMGFFLLKPFYWVKCSPNKVFEYLICGVVPVIRANIDHEETLSPCSLIFDQSYSDDEIVNDVLNVIKNKDVMLHKINGESKRTFGKIYLGKSGAPIY